MAAFRDFMVSDDVVRKIEGLLDAKLTLKNSTAFPAKLKAEEELKKAENALRTSLTTMVRDAVKAALEEQQEKEQS